MIRMLQTVGLAAALILGAVGPLAAEGGAGGAVRSAAQSAIDVTIEPGQTVTIKTAPNDYTELVLRNEGDEDACGTIISPDGSENFCIRPGETLKLVKFFGGEVMITNLSATASISVVGKWL